MNFQNKKILVLVFLTVIGVSYLLGDFFLSSPILTNPSAPSASNQDSGAPSMSAPQTGETQNLFHTLPNALKIPQAISISPPNSFAELVKKVQPAVVNIATAKSVTVRNNNPLAQDPFFRQFLPPGQQGTSKKQENSLGTGFLINEKGDIITNNHVIDGADEILVTLDDGREIQAKVVGRDPKLDVAIIRLIKEDKYPYLTLGDSDSLEVGEWVVAVGNPFGLGHTVTAGIVSAKARYLGAGPYDDFIQTDASINPGNSGGPLFNTNGEVVGINSAIIAAGQGLGFAIPINMAKEIVPQLISKGSVTRGWMGVGIEDLTNEEAGKFGLKPQEGVLVAQVVPGGPADQAGIKMGDVLLSLNDQKIEGSHNFPAMVAKLAPGSSVKVVLLSNSSKYEKNILLGSLDQNGGSSAGATPSKGALGLTLRDLSPAERDRLRINAVLVVGVASGSQAESLGIREGDLIIEVNSQSVASVAQLKAAMSNTKTGQIIKVGLVRGGVVYYFAFKKE